MSKSRKSRRRSAPRGNLLHRFVLSPDVRFWMLALFVTLAFLMGGSARPDTQSLVILRPLAILFGAYAIFAMSRAEWEQIKWPAAMFGLLAMTMVIQLVPLPPAFWTGLPMREPIAELGSIFGVGDIWRPISMAPERTINALAALSVPFAALLLFAIQEREKYRAILLVLICMAIASAAMGIAQLTGSPEGPLYTYRITNSGSAVGLLANRNHQAVFLAATAFMAAWFLLTELKRERPKPMRMALSGAAILLGIVVIMVIGSRAGLVVLALSIAATVRFAIKEGWFKAGKGKRGLPPIYRKMVAGLGLLLFAIVAFVVLQSRSLTLDRLFDSIGDDSVADLRAELTPVLFRMIGDFFPFGSGFGSFEDAYRLFEPFEILTPRYVNQAHNDWAQFLIEGGLAGLAIIGVFAFWIIRRLQGVRSAEIHRSNRQRAVMAGVVLVMLGIASIVDYPLRTPALAVYATLLIAVIESSTIGLRTNSERSNV